MTETLLTNHSNHVVVVTKTEKAREKKLEQIDPPDGGSRAYLVMISAFLCNGILFGIINTYSVIYLSLQKQLRASDDEAASSKAGECFGLGFHQTFPYNNKMSLTMLTHLSISEVRSRGTSLREQGNVIFSTPTTNAPTWLLCKYPYLVHWDTIFFSLDIKCVGLFVLRRSISSHS